jgi:hypothetical protein
VDGGRLLLGGNRSARTVRKLGRADLQGVLLAPRADHGSGSSARVRRLENEDATVAEVDVRTLAGDQAGKARLVEPPSGVDSAGQREPRPAPWIYPRVKGTLEFRTRRAQQNLPLYCRLGLRSHWRVRRDDWHVHFRELGRAAAGQTISPANLYDRVYEPYGLAARGKILLPVG